ncbi:hypothetical protein Tco_0320351 [Tanacetum coccineum]
MAIEVSKDLSSLSLYELIDNLKVHEVVMKKYSKIYKGKKERVKFIALKAKKESSDDITSTSRSDDEEYVMAVRNFKKFFRGKGKFVRQPSEEKKSFRKRDDKKGKSDRKFFRCAEDKINDETCLMAQSLNEVTLDSSHYSDNASSLDDDSLGFDKSKASTCGTKPMSFVGSTAELAGDGSTIKADGSTIPGFVDPSTSQKQAEHVFRPPLSSRSDFVIVCLRTCLDPNEWIKDSGCSKHMTGNKSLFSTYKAYDGDNVWKKLQMRYLVQNPEKWIIKSWTFYENCRVHILALEDGTEIHMLVERRYPLIRETLERMMDLD